MVDIDKVIYEGQVVMTFIRGLGLKDTFKKDRHHRLSLFTIQMSCKRE